MCDICGIHWKKKKKQNIVRSCAIKQTVNRHQAAHVCPGHLSRLIQPCQEAVPSYQHCVLEADDG